MPSANRVSHRAGSADASPGVAHRIRAKRPQMSAAMAKIAALLLEDPTAPLNLSITELAEGGRHLGGDRHALLPGDRLRRLRAAAGRGRGRRRPRRRQRVLAHRHRPRLRAGRLRRPGRAGPAQHALALAAGDGDLGRPRAVLPDRRPDRHLRPPRHLRDRGQRRHGHRDGDAALPDRHQRARVAGGASSASRARRSRTSAASPSASPTPAARRRRSRCSRRPGRPAPSPWR